MQGIWNFFFLGCRWKNNQRKLNSVWHNTPHWKIVALICCAQRSPKATLITVFVSIVAWKQARWPPLFYYVFNISLSCNINIPSFIGNLWWDLLLGNHLKKYWNIFKRALSVFFFRIVLHFTLYWLISESWSADSVLWCATTRGRYSVLSCLLCSSSLKVPSLHATIKHTFEAGHQVLDSAMK